MALRLIPTDVSNLSKEQTKVLNRIKKIYENSDNDSYLYFKPKIRDLEADFVIIDPKRGISIIETNDLDASTIESITKKEIVTTDGEKITNPSFTTNQYFKLLKG